MAENEQVQDSVKAALSAVESVKATEGGHVSGTEMFDDLLHLETGLMEVGRSEGVASGAAVGWRRGFKLGMEHGRDVGAIVGAAQVMVAFWQSWLKTWREANPPEGAVEGDESVNIDNRSPSWMSSRAVKTLEGLARALDKFNEEDAQDEVLTEVLGSIRSKLRLLYAQLGVPPRRSKEPSM